MHAHWGISDHTFLMWFVVVATCVMAAAMVYRYVAFRGRRGSSDDIDAQHAAFLAAGPTLAVYSALGELRGAGAVGVDPGRILTTTAPLQTDATRLEKAVYEAALGGHAADRLPSHPMVSTTLDRVRGDLEQAGLLLVPPQTARARWFVYAELAVAAIGVVRVAVNLASGTPVGDLPSAFVLIGIFLLFMVSMPRRTRAGTAVLAELRRRHDQLAPPRKPSPSTFGPGAAAMAIALFGLGSLYALDPVFASNVGAPLRRPTFDAISLGGSGG